MRCQLCSSRRLLLTLDRATERVLAISSAVKGLAERYSRAWIWATVRFTPHFVPISPQWRMNRCSTGERVFIFPLILLLQKLQHKRLFVKGPIGPCGDEPFA